MNSFYYILSIGTLGISSYYLYKFGKNKANKYIMDKVMEELNKRMENEQEGFKPMRKSTSALINIQHGGNTNSIYIPYNRRLVTKMLNTRAFLLKGEDKIEITHKPGVPYLVSAKQMGGDMIVIENKEGHVLNCYKDDEIPNYF